MVVNTAYHVSPRRATHRSQRARNGLSAVRGKVFLFQNPAVVQFMAGNDVGKRADRDFILVGKASTRPGRFVKIRE